MDARTAIEAEGFQLSFIGNGTADHLAAFLDQFPEAGQAFTDPSRATYRALDLRKGVGSLLSLGMVTNGLRAVRSGHKQGITAGDPMQQGGLAVFSRQGTRLFLHRDATAGDSMSAELLVEILQEINANARQRGRRASS